MYVLCQMKKKIKNYKKNYDKRKITCLACSPQEIVTHVARIGTAYLHLTAGYTDIKMLIAKDLLLKKTP